MKKGKYESHLVLYCTRQLICSNLLSIDTNTHLTGRIYGAAKHSSHIRTKWYVVCALKLYLLYFHFYLNCVFIHFSAGYDVKKYVE